ncbi:outer membrane protein assembly factor BamB family protein [Phytomonospora endophytica]|uniref:Outer membrane protein assembly factor BamB n=1 Tax=Phytomonospora endophytica TaxID=714109 RepID=A0A841FVD2_9ACTN|nr:PQQ-binding-like beta-propeller repeat protein [Phytomonospora endophytica]MBB6035940.1 outer membrane protein assembly factor BamB [Phytomonospora endophytica]GIG66846.1 hypothetical protein Pen01_31410 [Phytomonospora endophytica]
MLVAGVVAVRATAPPPEVAELAAVWSAPLTPTAGKALATRVRGPVALVIGSKGLAAFDRASGAELWSRGYGDTLAGYGADGLDMYAANATVLLSGDAIVLPVLASGDPPFNPRGFEVLDLATGDVRFDVPGAWPDEADGAYATVTANTLIVVTFRELCELTAYALDDGRELWHLETTDGPLLPNRYSARNQLVAVPNRGPVLLEAPAGEFFLLTAAREEPGHLVDVTVLGTADAKVRASWTVAGGQDAPILEVVGEQVLDRGVRGRLSAYDPATGVKIWDRPTFYDFFDADPRTPWSLDEGRVLLDAARAESPGPVGQYLLIDLATGLAPQGGDVGGRKLIAIGHGSAIGLAEGTLTALTELGEEKWETDLSTRELTPGGFLTGEGRLVLDGPVVGRRDVWAVELADGRTSVAHDGFVNGYEEGALVVYGGVPGEIRLYELGGS